ncbi:response regulator [Neptunicoccus cionae]|uniref:histidine kinase n=1 Tax=Neptunicoccus cionae TaxID=2035344 RepID=A0A916VS21_9RHOB|nr:response regulator [Amylibacter cionae]GGA28485.1 histidine kinase [Amylibacter cionae]
MKYLSRTSVAKATGARTRPQFVFRLAWALLLIGGIALVVLLSAQLSSKIDELREVPEDNAQWNLSQIEVAFLKLRIAADNVLLEGEPALPEFRKWFDIHYSRIELVSTSTDAMEIHQDPQLHHLHEMLLKFNRNMVVLVDGPDSLLVASMPDFVARMQEIAFAPRELSVGGVELKSARSDAKRKEIVRILQTIALVSTLVMISLIGAFIFLWVQRRRLNMQSAEIRKAGKFHQTILRASLDAIVVVDGQGKITDFNGSAEKVFGLNRADVIGHSLSDTILPERYRSGHEAGMANYTSPENSNIVDQGRLELVAVHADGHEFPVEVSISEAHSADGRIFVSYIRDITEEKQNKEDLHAARDQALEAYKEKSRFLAVMSHEMRTPLNGIISSLHLLRDDPLSERQERFVNLADHSSNVLLNHINDVLTIERLDSGETKSAEQVFSAREVAEDLLDVMRPLADEQNTSLLLEVEGEEAFVLGEQRLIEQVLTNLLSNAIKFTASGQVTLGIASRWVSASNLELDFSVSDTGIGISPEGLQTVFDDFVTAESPYERTAKGTGLGLGIVRRLVETMGGELHFDSILGEGSIFGFTITLPVQDEILPEKQETTASAQPAVSGGLKVLVVEDNPINRELLGAMLERDGHIVSFATDGFEGVHVASKNVFDVILMDISMPNMNGIKATTTIKNSQGLSRNTPIYAVTAHAMPAEIAEFEKAGMEGCLLKPIRVEKLRAILGEISQDDPVEAPQTETPMSSNANGIIPLLSPDQLMKMREVFGPETMIDKVQAFLKEGDLLIGAVLNNTLEQDRETLQSSTHKLSGSCAIFGATLLRQTLTGLETACKEGDAEAAAALQAKAREEWNRTKTALNAIYAQT